MKYDTKKVKAVSCKEKAIWEHSPEMLLCSLGQSSSKMVWGKMKNGFFGQNFSKTMINHIMHPSQQHGLGACSPGLSPTENVWCIKNPVMKAQGF